MEEQNCHRIAMLERAENRQDREQLGAASAQIQQIILEARVDEKTAEEAKRTLAVFGAERQAMAHMMGYEEAAIAENAQKRIQHAEASVAGVADEAQRRLAQEENEILRTQSIVEQI
eukprot:2704083-Pyramimonas_sp.AAC.1